MLPSKLGQGGVQLANLGANLGFGSNAGVQGALGGADFSVKMPKEPALPDISKIIADALAASRPVAAPVLNTNAILAQSRAAAANKVNPLYTQYLHQYLQNEVAAKKAQQAQNQATIKNLQAQEANALQGNQLTRTATADNTQAALGNINQQEQTYQQETGLQSDQARQALLNNQGALAGSGLGQQQDTQAQELRNIKEAAQEGQYTYSRQQHQLFSNQTFDQLANSDALSKLKETEGENASNFSLNNYLRQAADAEFQFRTQNRQQHEQALNASTQSLYQHNIINAINQYRNNPALYDAAYQAYVR